MEFCNLISFFLASSDGNYHNEEMDFESLANENIEIEVEYDFNRLIPPIEFYKEIIDEYCARMDSRKLAPLQKQISDKDSLIKAKDQQISVLTHQNTQLNNTINSIPHKKANLELESLQLDIANKKLTIKKQEKELGIKLNELETKITLNLINPNSATQRIKNQLSYKLGQAMINNSKSLLGYIRMPYVLSYIKETHQKEQELYKQSIIQNPNLKLPPLESYEDYKEAIKIKNHLTYKLGAALIKANNVQGGGANICIYWFPKRSA